VAGGLPDTVSIATSFAESDAATEQPHPLAVAHFDAAAGRILEHMRRGDHESLVTKNPVPLAMSWPLASSAWIVTTAFPRHRDIDGGGSGALLGRERRSENGEGDERCQGASAHARLSHEGEVRANLWNGVLEHKYHSLACNQNLLDSRPQVSDTVTPIARACP